MGWWHLKRERLTPSPPVSGVTATSRAWTLAAGTGGTEEGWGTERPGNRGESGFEDRDWALLPFGKRQI